MVVSLSPLQKRKDKKHVCFQRMFILSMFAALPTLSDGSFLSFLIFFGFRYTKRISLWFRPHELRVCDYKRVYYTVGFICLLVGMGGRTMKTSTLSGSSLLITAVTMTTTTMMMMAGVGSGLLRGDGD